jgi:RNA polymerase sigma factor (sigma-70 family)
LGAERTESRHPSGPQESPDSRSDLRLIALIAEGDGQAFHELYRKYQARLSRFLFNLVRHPHLAENRESGEASPEDEYGMSTVHGLLRKAMAELSPDHRAVVDLTYFHELGYREIAEILGCPVDTVKTRMFYARRHLRRCVEGDMSDWI